MRTTFLLLALAGLVSAQTLSGIFTNTIATPGQPMTLRVSNGGPATVQLTNGCGYNAVVAGTPTGPVVFAPLICPLILIQIQPCGSRNTNFTAPASLTPGVYYLRIDYRIPPATNVISESFPFSVQAAGAPLLAATTPARIGTSLLCDLSAPAAANGYYLTGASLSTNTGFSAGPGLFLSLDLDFLFALSFPVPDPVLFTNFQNSLSPTGTATGIGVNIPNIPQLLWKGVALQAAVVDAFGNPALTNALTFTLIP